MTTELTEEQQKALLEEQRQRYRLWCSLPGTQQFLKELSHLRLQTMEDWAHRAFEGTNIEEMAVQNAYALGGIRVLDDLLAKETFDE